MHKKMLTATCTQVLLTSQNVNFFQSSVKATSQKLKNWGGQIQEKIHPFEDEIAVVEKAENT